MTGSLKVRPSASMPRAPAPPFEAETFAQHHSRRDQSSNSAKQSLRSHSSSFEADDERSSSADDNMGPGTGFRDGPSTYAGEDTRLTSRKELNGWFAYGFAAEVFVICGMGEFPGCPCFDCWDGRPLCSGRRVAGFVLLQGSGLHEANMQSCTDSYIPSTLLQTLEGTLKLHPVESFPKNSN